MDAILSRGDELKSNWNVLSFQAQWTAGWLGVTPLCKGLQYLFQNFYLDYMSIECLLN